MTLRENRLHRWALFTVFSVAFAARFVGVMRLLPYNFPAEGAERDLLERVIGLFLQSNLDPKQFDWPPLFQYVVVFALKVWAFLSVRLGFSSSVGAFITDNTADRTGLYFLARTLATLFGMGTVAAVYAISKEIYGRWHALAATFFIAVAPLHVAYSYIFQIDAPTAFFSTAALFYVLRVYSRGDDADYVKAGVLIGLGTATKYLPFLLVFAVFLAQKLGVRRERGAKKLAFCFLAVLAAFFAASPYSFLRLASLLDIGNQFQTASSVPLGANLTLTLEFVKEGLGLPLFVLGALGLILAFRGRPKETAVLSCYPLAVWIFILCWKHSTGYYFLPLVPAFAIFVGDVSQALSVRLKTANQRALAWILIFALPVKALAAYEKKVLRLTTVEEMKTWVDEHLAANSDILTFYYPFDVPLSMPVENKAGAREVLLYGRYNHRFLRGDVDYDLGRFKKEGVQYIIISEGDGSTESGRRLIGAVERSCRLIKEVDADPEVRLGPTIKAFQL